MSSLRTYSYFMWCIMNDHDMGLVVNSLINIINIYVSKANYAKLFKCPVIIITEGILNFILIF